MGKLKLVIALIVVAIFVYFLASNTNFRNYVGTSLTNINTSMQESQFISVYSHAKNMSEGEFINWSVNSSNTNAEIANIKNTFKNSSLEKERFGELWDSIAYIKNSTNVSYIYNSVKVDTEKILNNS